MPTGIGSGIAGEVFTDEIGSGSRGGSTICPTRYSVNLNGLSQIGQETGTLLDLGTNNFSYSFWFKTSETSVQGIFSTDFNNTGVGLDIFLSASGILTATFDSVTFPTTASLNDGEWYHAVLSVDRSGDWKWYIDGINTNTLANPVGTAIFVGNYLWGNSFSTSFFKGNLTELSIWGTALSSSEVLTIYNNMFGSQTCLTDLTFSSGNLIQNGSFNEIGPQLIDNPTFNAPTSPDLIVNGDFSAEGINLVDNPNFTDGVELLTQPIDLTVDFIPNGSGVIDDSNSFTTTGAAFDGLRNNSSAFQLIDGKSYKLVIEGTTTSSGFTIGSVTANGNEYGTGFGTHYFVATTANPTTLWIRQQTAGTTDLTTFTIEELGADWVELINDPDSVSFGENGLTIVQSSDGGPDNRAYQGSVTEADKSYKVIYTIQDAQYTASNRLEYYNGAGYYAFPEQDEGTHTFYYTREGANNSWIFNLRTSTTSATDFVTISSISVQELGGGWTLGAGWSIGDSVASCDGTASSSLYQNVSGVENKTYKITGTVSNYTSGTLQVGGSSSALDVDEDGAFVHYRVWTSDPNLYLKSKPGDGFNGSITNVTVQEVDWNFGGGWSLGSNKALATAAVAYDTLSQTGVFTLDKSYKTTFLSTLDSGNCFAEFGSNGFIGQLPSGTASNLFYYQTNEVGDSARIAFEVQSPMTGSISNVLTYQMDPNGYWNIPTANSTQLVLNPMFTNTGPEEVTNGDFSQTILGSERITNGDFAVSGTLTSNSWSLGWNSGDSGVSISDGALNLVNNGGGFVGRAYANNGVDSYYGVLEVGKTYSLTYEVTENIDSANLFYYAGSYVPTSKDVAVHTVEFTATADFFVFRNGSANTTIKIDNVSVKEVLQLVTNGDFTEGEERIDDGDFPFPNTAWSLNTGVTVPSAGILDFDGTSGAYASQDILTAGKSYKVTIEVADASLTDTLSVFLGATNNIYGLVVAQDTTLVLYGVAGGSNDLFYVGSWEGTITNVSVEELGADWIQGGVPDDPGTFGENGLTITSVNGDGNVNRVRQRSVTAASKSYKVTYTIHSATLTGTNRFRYWAGTIYADLPTAITGTPQTFYYTTPPTTANFDWYFKVETFNGSTTDNVTVSDISVQELGEGWTVGGGWSIGDSEAIANGSTSPTNILSQDLGLVADKSYKITFNSDRVGGVGGVLFVRDSDDNTIYTLNSGTGSAVNTFYNTWAGSGGTLKFYAYSYNGSISNVSVEETGLDWVSPDAGIVNTFSATGLTMTSVNGTGDNTIQQVGVTADDQAYKVEYTIVGSSLTAGNYLQFYNGATYVNMKTSVGTHILHFTRSGADDSVFLKLASNDGSLTDTVDIGSITIVEVQGWTLEDGKLVGDLPDLAKSATQDIGAIAGNSYKATMDVALAEEELITNGSFREVGADLVLEGDFPKPSVHWLKAASTTINGGSATFGGLGTVADMLAGAFVVRVEADGGVVEAQSCLISDLTFLTENP